MHWLLFKRATLNADNSAKFLLSYIPLFLEKVIKRPIPMPAGCLKASKVFCQDSKLDTA